MNINILHRQKIFHNATNNRLEDVVYMLIDESAIHRGDENAEKRRKIHNARVSPRYVCDKKVEIGFTAFLPNSPPLLPLTHTQAYVFKHIQTFHTFQWHINRPTHSYPIRAH